MQMKTTGKQSRSHKVAEDGVSSDSAYAYVSDAPIKGAATVCAALLAVLVAVAVADEPAQSQPQPPASPSVFRMPAIQEFYMRLIAEAGQRLTHNGDLAEAEKFCNQAIQLAPQFSAGYYDLACVQARLGKKDEAFVNLEAAIAHGYNDAEHLQKDDDLKSLRGDKRFRDGIDRIVRAAAVDERTVERAVVVQPGEAFDGRVVEIGEKAGDDNPAVALHRDGAHRAAGTLAGKIGGEFGV